MNRKRIISLLVLVFCVFAMTTTACYSARKKSKKKSDFLPDLVVIGDNVNLRAAPNTSSRIVTRMKRGTLLGIIGEAPDEWYNVDTETGYRGYVFAKYVEGASVLFDH